MLNIYKIIRKSTFTGFFLKICINSRYKAYILYSLSVSIFSHQYLLLFSNSLFFLITNLLQLFQNLYSVVNFLCHPFHFSSNFVPDKKCHTIHIRYRTLPPLAKSYYFSSYSNNLVYFSCKFFLKVNDIYLENTLNILHSNSFLYSLVSLSF